MAPVVCTIVAKNYLALAATLCESLLERHPAGECHVLVIDELAEGERELLSGRPFRLHFLEDLRIPRLCDFRFRYNVTELSTAVKPVFLRHLFRECGVERVFYMDPDILVTGSLEALWRKFDDHDVLLTPHLDTDYPEDGRFPNDAHILRSGIFNLGFIGVKRGENGGKFLDWWWDKLYYKCIVDHSAGYFVDQRFVDLAFVLFEGFHVERDPAYNAAYWNLHSRRIGRGEGGWTVNGAPLAFYHFSNYKLSRPREISGFQNRVSMEENRHLEALFAEYRERLAGNGHAAWSKEPYRYDFFADGKRIPYLFRKLYRKILTGKGVEDPFDHRRYPLSWRAGLLWMRVAQFLLDRMVRRVKNSDYLSNLASLLVRPFPRQGGGGG